VSGQDPEVFSSMTWKFPDEIKKLDLTVLHYFVIEKGLGIAGKDQSNTENIEFDRNFTSCLEKVILDQAQFALITQDISLEDIIVVCKSGYTMPQKSTYFYPKVVCGFLFASIAQDEFDFPPDFSL